MFCYHHVWTPKRQLLCWLRCTAGLGWLLGPIFGPKICICLRYTHVTPIFRAQAGPTQWIISPPYPEVTRITSVFRYVAVWPLGGPFFGLQAGFWPLFTVGETLPDVPLILVRGWRNLAGIPGAPKKWYGGPTEPVPTGITEKRPFLRLAEKRKTGRKSVFRYSNHPKLSKRLIFIWEKGTFSFWQLCPVVAGTWLE